MRRVLSLLPQTIIITLCSVPCALLGHGTDVPLKHLALFSFLVLWSSLCSYHWAVQKCSSYQITLVYEHRHSYLDGNITSIPCLFTKKAAVTFSLELIWHPPPPPSSSTMVYSSKCEFSPVECDNQIWSESSWLPFLQTCHYCVNWFILT